MRIAAVIPSRFGSSRFEGKPLAMIDGCSMIQRVYDSAAKAAKVDTVVVATDDDRILKAVSQFGGRAVMTSSKCRSGTDRVAEAARLLALANEDIVINVQGDQPLVNPLCFDQVVAPLIQAPEIGMSTLAFKIVDQQEYTNPKDCKLVMDRQGFALYFSRQAIPCARDQGLAFDAFKHLGVYAYTHRFLKQFTQWPIGQLENIEKLEQLRTLENGHRIKVVITEYDSPEVDLPEDILRIEKKLQLLKSHP
ncbi:MAG: 3-deoxy-manno-octulosonate cytidylyltransferase [Desulfobacteraceae bacterium]|nr:3-deoxy-manno-octulosonate cytidylyltransferase [Desulfobacteraceae bacterium]